jgi:hypothetical protein
MLIGNTASNNCNTGFSVNGWEGVPADDDILAGNTANSSERHRIGGPPGRPQPFQGAVAATGGDGAGADRGAPAEGLLNPLLTHCPRAERRDAPILHGS